MKDDFFEFIDSKEKAYWLGFIYAEGYIETRDQKPYRLGIEISKDDEILIVDINEYFKLNYKNL